VESCVSETLHKTSLKFVYDFVKPEDRTEIFKHSYITDPDKYAYFKL
jgi:outer membrane protein assembly factor BamA